MNKVKTSWIALLMIGLTTVLFLSVVNGQDEELPEGVGPIQDFELAEEIDPADGNRQNHL